MTSPEPRRSHREHIGRAWRGIHLRGFVNGAGHGFLTCRPSPHRSRHCATTENPFFSVVSPLLSRSLVLALQPLSDDDIQRLLVIRRMKPLEFSLDEMKRLLDSLDLLSGADGDEQQRREAATFVIDCHHRAEQSIARLRKRLAYASELTEVLAREARRVAVQAEVIGMVNELSDPRDVVVCAAGSMPGAR